MKLSQYYIDIEIDETKKMLYSTFSRKYYVYKKQEQSKVLNFLAHINKGKYTEAEIALFEELLNKKIILRDEIDELKQLEVLENATRYQEKTYKMMIYATNACNFRCSYCEQNHVSKPLSEDVKERILKLVKIQAKKNRVIQIDWFGGEPLLEYESVCSVLERAKKICEKNKCELVSTLTTNGYLLDESKIKKLYDLSVRSMQITLDGSKKTHNERRILADGSATFDIIFKNMIEAVKLGVFITLRINIDAKNADDISEVIDEIPMEFRSRIAVDICNIFQNSKRISTYALMKQIIDKGYVYSQRWNKFASCHACLLNGVVIDTDGSILLCSNTDKREKRMGYLNSEGCCCIERQADLYNLQTVTARENPECRNCIELPYCIASCKYARLKDNTKCLGKRGNGLTIKEKALLDFYYDQQKERREKDG